MDFEQFIKWIRELPFGKRLNNAVYVYAESLASMGGELHDFVEEIRTRLAIEPEFNLIKFYLSAFKLSFLSYPGFLEDPHPELKKSLTVDLAAVKARRHDYSNSHNPPILHRKETFLDLNHPLVSRFKALTVEEEAAGLYGEPKIIGFKRNWESLLAAKGLAFAGHKLVKKIDTPGTMHEGRAIEVQRHKTAIARYKFSKPIQTLLENGLLTEGTSLLDYGCGQGDDASRLEQMGFAVTAWDPVYFPAGSKDPADIVNLGFVLNVIEDPTERIEVLHEAYELSRKLLVISALVSSSSTATLGRPYKDGILTSRNTFQKYFRQEELERYIEDALDTSAIAVGLGIFYVFRSPADQQQFLSNRTRRSINWVDLSRGLRQVRERRPRPGRGDPYEPNKELLDAFWAKMLDLGRIPLKDEFERYDELRTKVGSANKAKNLFVKKFGEETLTKAFELRRNDLQVYLALSNFRKRVPFKHLPASVRRDITTFLGSYQQAFRESQELLFSAGNPDVITQLCDTAVSGWKDDQALYVHRNLITELHPVLRIYVGCAGVMYGDLTDVDVIKIHKRSGKISLLKYDDFEGKPLPALHERIKVNLRRQAMDIFDHRSEENQEVLYLKERYVSAEHPGREKWKEFSETLRNLGMNLSVGYGPSQQELVILLEKIGAKDMIDRLQIDSSGNEPE